LPGVPFFSAAQNPNTPMPLAPSYGHQFKSFMDLLNSTLSANPVTSVFFQWGLVVSFLVGLMTLVTG
ncbi:hypothetical protein, partial [Enterobacter cloacae]|uniref:hypothetical protein n=1 Tax=Enterobacter cloacae TaxID=550 RepID=UPI001BCD4A6A